MIDITEELPLVTVQVILFDQGAHPSRTNAFVIMQFPFRVASYSGETGQCVAVAATDGDE